MTTRQTRKPLNCDLPDCVTRWRYMTYKTQLEEDIDYNQGGAGLQHCVTPECHQTYWRGVYNCTQNDQGHILKRTGTVAKDNRFHCRNCTSAE